MSDFERLAGSVKSSANPHEFIRGKKHGRLEVLAVFVVIYFVVALIDGF